MDGVAGLFQVNDGRPGIAPHRQGDGVVNALLQFCGRGHGQANRVELAQARQAHAQRQRAQAIAARYRVLRDQADLAKTHQIGVGFGRRHPGLYRELLQAHGAATVGQRDQNLATYFDGLNAAPLLFVFVLQCHGVYFLN